MHFLLTGHTNNTRKLDSVDASTSSWPIGHEVALALKRSVNPDLTFYVIPELYGYNHLLHSQITLT
jgi:hypothetical protein